MTYPRHVVLTIDNRVNSLSIDYDEQLLQHNDHMYHMPDVMLDPGAFHMHAVVWKRVLEHRLSLCLEGVYLDEEHEIVSCMRLLFYHH